MNMNYKAGAKKIRELAEEKGIDSNDLDKIITFAYMLGCQATHFGIVLQEFNLPGTFHTGIALTTSVNMEAVAFELTKVAGDDGEH